MGQSPRTDLTNDLTSIIDESTALIEKGVLDDFTLAQVNEQFCPKEGHTILATRMRNGTQVKIAKELILELIQQRIDELNDKGITTIILLCTGHFPTFKSKALLLYPEIVLQKLVADLIGTKKLGTYSPDQIQVPQVIKKWRKYGIEVNFYAASPYIQDGKIEEVAHSMKNNNDDYIFLDCMGYTSSHKKMVESITGKPVFLPREMIFSIAKCLS